MEPFAIRPFESADREAVVALWRAAGLARPVNDPYRDINRKVAVDPGGFLVAVLEDRLAGTAMLGYDGHRGWVNYFGVDPAFQRLGVGRRLMEAVVRLAQGRGCPKINLQVRRSNLQAVGFYEALGFREDDVMSMGLRLVDDQASEA